MSEADVEFVRGALDAWNSGEREISLDEVDPDVEVNSRFSSLAGQPYRGTHGLRQWLADIDDQFDLWRVELDEIHDLGGGRILLLARIHARGRTSAVMIDDWPMAMVIELRDGRLWRLAMRESQEQALKAAGLE